MVATAIEEAIHTLNIVKERSSKRRSKSRSKPCSKNSDRPASNRTASRCR